MAIVIVVQGQADLFEIILALSSSGGFSSLLYRRQQQRDENSDNCDHDQ